MIKKRILTPGLTDILGAALSTNTVTVNGGVAVVSGSFTNAGNVFTPQTPEVFKYDADGNLTNDGRWAYVWDVEMHSQVSAWATTSS